MHEYSYGSVGSCQLYWPTSPHYFLPYVYRLIQYSKGNCFILHFFPFFYSAFLFFAIFTYDFLNCFLSVLDTQCYNNFRCTIVIPQVHLMLFHSHMESKKINEKQNQRANCWMSEGRYVWGMSKICKGGERDRLRFTKWVSHKNKGYNRNIISVVFY